MQKSQHEAYVVGQISGDNFQDLLSEDNSYEEHSSFSTCCRSDVGCLLHQWSGDWSRHLHNNIKGTSPLGHYTFRQQLQKQILPFMLRQECDFLADSYELISCMKDPCDTLHDWRIRHATRDMESCKYIRGKFYRIYREKNFTPDQLAKNASTIFRCSSFDQCGDCPLKQKTM